MDKVNFRTSVTKRFIDAFPKFENNEGDGKIYFWEAWQKSPFFVNTLTKEDMQNVYNALLAEYYNWHYKYTDDLGITLNTFKTVAQYYPNCKERIKLADDLRVLSLDDFAKSNISINSQGQNPKIKGKKMDEMIELVDSQNASFQLKSQEATIRAKFVTLFDGIIDDFCLRFRPLFVKIYSGVNSYVYSNKEIGNEEE